VNTVSSSRPERPRGRILLAKPGLDGHDRGALVLLRALRDAGFEVIYTGRRQSAAQIADAAIQEGVDLIGLSILSGSNVELSRRLLDELAARDASDIPVVVGGTIRADDQPQLEAMGIAGTFPIGTTLQGCVDGIDAVLARTREDAGAHL
jgi:methylmalonyl-CoA mutase C-terminal domain/subunit